LLLQFAKQQFKRSFAFEWDGTDTRIHDGDGRKISFAVLLKLADQLSDQAIEENVRINIFKWVDPDLDSQVTNSAFTSTEGTEESFPRHQFKVRYYPLFTWRNADPTSRSGFVRRPPRLDSISD
jgi:hypothetical protein